MRASPFARGPLAALLIAALAGCTAVAPSNEPAAPVSSLLGPGLGIRPSGSAAAFYPLQVGNRWDYTNHLRLVVEPDAGVPQPPTELTMPWAAEVIGTTTVNSRAYFLQAEYDPRVAAPLVGVPIRQDRGGLYQWDPVRDGPADAWQTRVRGALRRATVGLREQQAFQRAADRLAQRLSLVQRGFLRDLSLPGPEPAPGEIAFLRYPLRPGAQWVVRAQPLFSRRVVGIELLQLPAGRFEAWRIEGTSELFGPADHATFWYSREGLVSVRFHAESEATDELGNHVGRLIADSEQDLVSLRLGAGIASAN